MSTTTYSKTASAAGQTIKIARRAGARHWCFWLALIALPLALYAAPKAPLSVPGRILIKPKARLSESDLAGRLNGHGAAQGKKFRHLNVRVIAVAQSKTDAVLAALRNDPDIEFAEPDYLAQAAFVPNDTYVLSGEEWHLVKIQLPQAWNLTTGRTNVVIAVIDSGVNTAHPDLADRILPGYDFVSGGTNTSDDLGHGTAVAGTVVAAGNNGLGVAGVAYGCTVLPVKVMGTSGVAAYSTVAESIEYAVNCGARIINLSLAGSSPSLTLQSAINYAWSNNVVVVAAAGNNANNAPQYPAACEHVVAVAATAANDSLAWFSSYGSFLTLSAPGDNIWTTQRDPLNPYGASRGTSFASPVVAGVAALIASVNPLLSNTQIVDILERTADDLGLAGYDGTFGYGRVNAFRAVSAAGGEPGNTPPIPTFPPTVNLTSPADKAEFAPNVITLSGTAQDNGRVEQVLVKFNGGAFQSATVTRPKPNTADWIMPMTLVAGTNTVEIKAVDSLGNESVLVSRRFFLRVPSLLIVRTNGHGSVAPNLSGSNLLVGRAYTMTAAPGMNWLLTNWVSNVDGVTQVATNGAKITFLMQTNLELAANFVTNPFIGAAGTYYGLFSDPTGVAHQSAGYIKFLVTKGLTFSGTIYVEGEAVALVGKFDLAGVGTLTKLVARKGLTNEPINVVPVLDFAGKKITGTVSSLSNGWTAEIDTDLAVYNLVNSPPAGTLGRYTIVLPSSGLAGQPSGDGYATFNVKRNATSGAVSLAVDVDPVLLTSLSYFGDQERMTPVAAVPPSKDGRYPFYAKLYKYYRPAPVPPLPNQTTYKGSVLGWLTIGSSNAVGDLVWNKIGWTNGAYDAGFSNEVTVAGSPYVPPAAFQKVINLGSNAVVVFEGGGLTTPITNKFHWILTGTGTNKLVWPTAGTTNNPNKISLTVNAPTGRIEGTFVPDTNAPTVKAMVKGAVLQNANTARGNFKGTSASGSMLMYQP